ncbi:predicted protein [Ostreococcus lucimarinus CCE9901]|uniref:Uncharacterized protein n=1 Tax=Ostreococcus lucimarinus (strain CCE9901) TaxID=436017 RepID=A4S5A9_OSTLU|nr:predicted protein [Ostreococcus lucimarinus CCE9901]ABO98868.1 predicted protein [Ostreococcus lucimarinus CCE9901]|eukprot:XP_001420575.1 predicted protein [Ostreococcus lucimarinus CCE9901]
MIDQKARRTKSAGEGDDSKARKGNHEVHIRMWFNNTPKSSLVSSRAFVRY